MPLTLAWWNETKKKYPKVPTTGLTPALTKYEKALAAFTKAETVDNLNDLRAALKVVETARTKALELMDGKKELDQAHSVVHALDTSIKKAKAEMVEAEKRLDLAYKQEKAGSKLEAEYEGLWHDFEKLRDELAKVHDTAAYPKAIQQLDLLHAKAEKITMSDDHHLIGKYQKQLKLVASLTQDFKTRFADYQEAVKRMVLARVVVNKEFEACDKVFTEAEGKMPGIKTKAENAKKAGNATDLLNAKKEAAGALQTALDRYKDLSEGAYHPNSPTRSNADKKEAKMSDADAIKFFKPLSDKSFTANKDLIGRKKLLEAAAKEILLIQ